MRTYTQTERVRQTYMHAYMHICMHACILAGIQLNIHKDTYTDTLKHLYTMHTNTDIHTDKHMY